jgi:hypothetical protein
MTEESDAPGKGVAVWSGSEFGFFFVGARPEQAVKLQRVGTDGSLVGSTTTISETIHAVGNQLHADWSGTQYGAVWSASNYGEGIYFAVVSPSGTRVGADIQVSETAISGEQNHSLKTLWTGSEWVVVWNPIMTGFLFRRLEAAGTPTGSEISIIDTVGGAAGPHVAWADTEIGVAWSDDTHGSTEVSFARFQPDGTKIGSDIRITNSLPTSVVHSLAWTGSEYGLIWIETDMPVSLHDGVGPTKFARLTKEGTIIEAPSDMGESRLSCDSRWTGSEFLLTNYTGDIQRCSPTGEAIGGALRIYVSTAAFSIMKTGWSGTSLGVFYPDNRYSDNEYYFLLVETCE